MRLWIDREVPPIADAQKFMDMLVDRTVKIVSDEPIDIYVNPTRVTLIRESVEAETLVEFEGDKREAIALPIEKVRELIDQAMSSMATTRARR